VDQHSIFTMCIIEIISTSKTKAPKTEKLRFWGFQLSPDSVSLAPLVELLRRANYPKLNEAEEEKTEASPPKAKSVSETIKNHFVLHESSFAETFYYDLLFCIGKISFSPSSAFKLIERIFR
jgi:hypothetical protein